MNLNNIDIREGRANEVIDYIVGKVECDSPFCNVDNMHGYSQVFYIVGHCNPDADYSYAHFVYCSKKCAKQGYCYQLGFKAGKKYMKRKIKNL